MASPAKIARYVITTPFARETWNHSSNRATTGSRRCAKKIANINAIKGRHEDIQKTIIKAYQDITKEKWATAAEWEIWWGKKKATFEIPK